MTSELEPLPRGFDPHSPTAQLAHTVLDGLARRHKHRVVGLENIPAGPCLLVVNHSLATYDIMLLSHAVYEKHGRMPRGLGDKRLFQVPGLASLVRYFGGVMASHDRADSLLDQGFIVLVAPGGMREALRPAEHRYEVQWADRRGFIRLAIRTRTPIVLAACPAADDLFDVARSDLTDRLYRNFHVPVPVLKGLSGLGSLLPRATPLTHLLGEPLAPPEVEDADLDSAVDAFHSEVSSRMDALMAEALALGTDGR